jgi:hypothetical protein
MPDADKGKEAEWEFAPGFKESWWKAKEKNSKISEAMTEFDRCKRSDRHFNFLGR